MIIDRKKLIIEMRKQRKSYREIGEELGLSKQRVHQIVNGDKYTPKKLIKEIKERDEGKCQICDSKKKIEVHHINGKRQDNDPHNLVTLCRKCHIKVEKNDRKILRGYGPHYHHGTIVLRKRGPKSYPLP